MPGAVRTQAAEGSARFAGLSICGSPKRLGNDSNPINHGWCIDVKPLDSNTAQTEAMGRVRPDPAGPRFIGRPPDLVAAQAGRYGCAPGIEWAASGLPPNPERPAGLPEARRRSASDMPARDLGHLDLFQGLGERIGPRGARLYPENGAGARHADRWIWAQRTPAMDWNLHRRAFSRTSAAVAAAPLATRALSEFFFVIAREVYPRYEFAALSEDEFGASIAFD